MKKFLIILSLFLPLTTSYAVTIDELIERANTLWKAENSMTVPDFSLTDTEGNQHTDESTKGKYLIVNFWASWCPPCLKEIPAFVEFYEKNQDKVLILGLDYEQTDQQAIADFTDQFMVNYPIILFDKENGPQFSEFGDILGMPTTYIYDPKGNLIDSHMGEMNIADLEKIIL